MDKKKDLQGKIISSATNFFVFLCMIFWVKFLDVAAIGPENTSIGFSTINWWLHNLTGVNMTWYKVSNITGYLAIAFALAVWIIAIIQLIKRKSFAKIDKEIAWASILYIVLALVYFFFKVVVINYRPIIMPGDLHVEGSFPSSHTLFAWTIYTSLIFLIKKYVTKKNLKVILEILVWLIIAVTLVGRILSGAHWGTDILGGILIGNALVIGYSAILVYNDIKNQEKN
jgi:undecaprenyl-diphosphatase